MYFAIDSLRKKKQDGVTWLLTCVWRGGDRVTPSGGGGFPDVQRESVPQGAKRKPEGYSS